MHHQGEFFFPLPRGRRLSMPLVDDAGQPLHLSLIEVGCKPGRKRGQLLSKRELLTDFCSSHPDSDWQPQIYRTLAHYDSAAISSVYTTAPEPDLTLVYTAVSTEQLAALTEGEQESLRRAVSRSPSSHSGRLERLLAENDAAGFHSLVISSDAEPSYSTLRGKIAEVLVMRDIQAVKPPNVQLLCNGHMYHFNQRYQNGTEIDGVLFFYGPQPFQEMIKKLRGYTHVIVQTPVERTSCTTP